MALDVGRVVGEVVAIDERDREGCWLDYVRVRVNIDMIKPL